MKKRLLFLCLLPLCGALALTVAVRGAETHAKKLTAEQKAVLKYILAKYDKNKDGKLDKAEKAKITAQDKEKLKKVGLSHLKKDTKARAEAR